MKLLRILFVSFLFISSISLFAQIDVDPLKEKLLEGNKRFVNSQMIHINQDLERRKEMFEGQNPFAVIVGCSDSRIPPEIIFDQGLGDLFVIRTAGHVVDDIALGSIEYAVEHLGVQLVVVLGHEKCGAVNAAVQGGKLHGNLEELVEEITPAVNAARNLPGDLLTNSIEQNVKHVQKEIIDESEIIRTIQKNGNVKIIGGVYSLSNGAVTFLE